MQLRLEQPPPDVPHLVLQHLVLVQQPVGRRTEPSSRARAAAEPRYRVSSARCTVHQALKTRLGPRVPVGEVGILETVQLLPRGGKRDFRESMLWRATSGLISREPSIAVDSKDFRRASSLPTRSAHDFDARLLVTGGSIILTIDGQSTTYTAGDQCEVQNGTVHAEKVGPGGVQLVVAKRS